MIATIVKNIKGKLQQLTTLQSDLRSILNDKGFTNSDNEHLPELIPKVAQISEQAYAVEGTIMLVSNSNTLIINNLPQKPVEVGIMCKSLRDVNVTSTEAETASFVVCDLLALFENDKVDSITVSNVTVTRSQETSGIWTITLTTTDEYQFKAGYVYTWVALSHIVAG